MVPLHTTFRVRRYIFNNSRQSRPRKTSIGASWLLKIILGRTCEWSYNIDCLVLRVTCIRFAGQSSEEEVLDREHARNSFFGVVGAVFEQNPEITPGVHFESIPRISSTEEISLKMPLKVPVAKKVRRLGKESILTKQTISAPDGIFPADLGSNHANLSKVVVGKDQDLVGEVYSQHDDGLDEEALIGQTIGRQVNVRESHLSARFSTDSNYYVTGNGFTHNLRKGRIVRECAAFSPDKTFRGMRRVSCRHKLP